MKIPAKVVWREYMESLAVAVAIALILRLLVLTAYKIPTGSMQPTLKPGDFVFAARMTFGFPIPFSGGERLAARLPKRGDVVVFRLPGSDPVLYVKRVIGLPGDKVELRQNALILNDEEARYQAASEAAIADMPDHESYKLVQEELKGSSRVVALRTGDQNHSFGPVIVPPGHVFVLGDNRDSSDDSRYWGPVPAVNLEGRVWLVWLSLDWSQRWADDRMPSVRWPRLLHGVQ